MTSQICLSMLSSTGIKMSLTADKILEIVRKDATGEPLRRMRPSSMTRIYSRWFLCHCHRFLTHYAGPTRAMLRTYTMFPSTLRAA